MKLIPPVWVQKWLPSPYMLLWKTTKGTQVQEWAKLIPSLKAYDCWELVFKMDISYCPETSTSFDSFYKLTVVFKWQLDS